MYQLADPLVQRRMVIAYHVASWCGVAVYRLAHYLHTRGSGKKVDFVLRIVNVFRSNLI